MDLWTILNTDSPWINWMQFGTPETGRLGSSEDGSMGTGKWQHFLSLQPTLPSSRKQMLVIYWLHITHVLILPKVWRRFQGACWPLIGLDKENLSFDWPWNTLWGGVIGLYGETKVFFHHASRFEHSIAVPITRNIHKHSPDSRE